MKHDLWARFADHYRPQLAERLAGMLADSGVNDAEPGSTTMDSRPDGHTFYVVSRARGRVSIGALPTETVNAWLVDVAVPYAEDLEARVGDRTRKATDNRRQIGDAHRKRAAELRTEGLSAPQIGIRIAHDEGRPYPYPERTVRKWLSNKG